MHQITHNIGGSMPVWLVSSLTSLDSTISLHTNNNIFPFLVKSSLVKPESSHAVILPPMVSVLWIHYKKVLSLVGPSSNYSTWCHVHSGENIFHLLLGRWQFDSSYLELEIKVKPELAQNTSCAYEAYYGVLCCRASPYHKERSIHIEREWFLKKSLDKLNTQGLC